MGKCKSKTDRSGILSIIIITAGIFLLASNSYAQNPGAIYTDRPDITESAIAVPYGSYQFEDGFLFENLSGSNNGANTDIHNYTYSTLLARIGLFRNFELRLGGDYLHQVASIDNFTSSNSGFNNLLLGGKYQFTREDANGQDLGLILQFYLPYGDKTVKPEGIEPELLFAFGKDLFEPLSVSVNIGSHWISAENKAAFLYSSSFDIDISESVDSFFEIYGDAPSGEKASFNFDFGGAYRPLNNLQIDASAGIETTAGPDNYFLSTGISFRLPR